MSPQFSYVDTSQIWKWYLTGNLCFDYKNQEHDSTEEIGLVTPTSGEYTLSLIKLLYAELIHQSLCIWMTS